MKECDPRGRIKWCFLLKSVSSSYSDFEIGLSLHEVNWGVSTRTPSRPRFAMRIFSGGHLIQNFPVRRKRRWQDSFKCLFVSDLFEKMASLHFLHRGFASDAFSARDALCQPLWHKTPNRLHSVPLESCGDGDVANEEEKQLHFDAFCKSIGFWLLAGLRSGI